MTQENGKDPEEGEICENEYEFVSEEEYFEEGSEREDEKKESARYTYVGERNTLEDSSNSLLDISLDSI